MWTSLVAERVNILKRMPSGIRQAFGRYVVCVPLDFLPVFMQGKQSLLTPILEIFFFTLNGKTSELGNPKCYFITPKKLQKSEQQSFIFVDLIRSFTSEVRKVGTIFEH